MAISRIRHSDAHVDTAHAKESRSKDAGSSLGSRLKDGMAGLTKRLTPQGAEEKAWTLRGNLRQAALGRLNRKSEAKAKLHDAAEVADFLAAGKVSPQPAADSHEVSAWEKPATRNNSFASDRFAEGTFREPMSVTASPGAEPMPEPMADQKTSATAESPTIETPTTEQPTIDTPTTPTTEKPATEKPATDSPATSKPPIPPRREAASATTTPRRPDTVSAEPIPFAHAAVAAAPARPTAGSLAATVLGTRLKARYESVAKRWREGLKKFDTQAAAHIQKGDYRAVGQLIRFQASKVRREMAEQITHARTQARQLAQPMPQEAESSYRRLGTSVIGHLRQAQTTLVKTIKQKAAGLLSVTADASDQVFTAAFQAIGTERRTTRPTGGTAENIDQISQLEADFTSATTALENEPESLTVDEKP